MRFINKNISLILILIIASSSLTILIFEPITAQSVPKPSVPQFALNLVENPYDVSPTYSIDPYTGKNVITQPGYHSENRSVEIKITNQPFTSINIGNSEYANLFYNISYNGRYENNCPLYSYDPNTIFIRQSDNEYTTISFTYIPNEGQIDFRVQAQIGYYTEYHMPFVAYRFTGEVSGWSNTQTITIPETSTTDSPNSTSSTTTAPTTTESTSNVTSVPLSLLVAVVAVFLVIIISLLIFYRRPPKTRQ